MKIMQINNVFRSGSTGKIVCDIHSYLQQYGHESIVCYGRLDVFTENNVYKTCGELEARFNRFFARITGMRYGGCFFSTARLIKIIKREQPDIIHLQCINGYFVNIYKLISYLKKNKINTVLTLHAEFMHTANCGYALECERWKTGCGKCPRLKSDIKSFWFDNTSLSWKRMKSAFDGYKNLEVVSVSRWLQDRAQQSPILVGKNHTTILNGIDTEIFNIKKNKEKKTLLNIENKKIVLHVTSCFSDREGHIKGGRYVLEMANRFLIYEDVVFLVVGKHDEIANLPTNVILLGNINNQYELAEYYSMANVTLLTSKKETFSMVVAESMCCGTPVVGFEAGAPEHITINQFSSFVQQGDCERLFDELAVFIYTKKFDENIIASIAKSKYSKETMGNAYIELYKKLLQTEHDIEQ